MINQNVFIDMLQASCPILRNNHDCTSGQKYEWEEESGTLVFYSLSVYPPDWLVTTLFVCQSVCKSICLVASLSVYRLSVWLTH